MPPRPRKSTTTDNLTVEDIEARHTTYDERQHLESNDQELFAIIATTHELDDGFIAGRIEEEYYDKHCRRLIQSYRGVREHVLLSLEEFARKYGIDKKYNKGIKRLKTGLTLTEESELSRPQATSPNEKVPPRVYTEIQGLFNRIVDSSGPLKLTDASQYYQYIRRLRKYLGSLPDVYSKEPAIQVNTEKWVRMLAPLSASYQLNVEELGKMNRDFAVALSDYNLYIQAQS